MDRSTLAAATLLLAVSALAASPTCPPFSVAAREVFDIAVDETDVYFTQNGALFRVPRSGGTPVPIAYLKQHHFMMIAVDEAQVFVNIRNTTKGVDSIVGVPKAGGAATELLRGFTAFAMVPDGEWLYLTTPGTFTQGRSNRDGAVVRVKKDGSRWEKIASGLRMPMGMLIDGEHLYVSERGIDSSDSSGGVKRLSKDGGRPKRVAKLPLATAMANDASNLYVATMAQRHEGSLYAVAKRGGAARELVDDLRFELILPLEVFDGSLFFGTALDEGKARLEAVDLSDGTRRTVAEFEGGSPFIAVDQCGVYFSTSAGIERAGP